MKVRLMHADRDFDPGAALPGNEPDLAADLELGILLDAMADGDKFLYEVARRGLYSGLGATAEVSYRQQVLADCVAQPEVVRELYDLAIEAIEAERHVYAFLFRASPDTILARSRQVMALYLASLHRLASLAVKHAPAFRSAGFTRFFEGIASELTDGYLAEVESRLAELEFKRGTLMSARLGRGSKAAGHVLRRHPPVRGWRERLTGRSRDSYSFTIPERDEAGARALSELTSRAVNETANSLAQSADHVKDYFQLLRAELAFYLGCLNLRVKLVARGQPVCYPVPGAVGTGRFAARGLYDASLALTLDGPVTGNGMAADGRQLIMITGANQGGKSTFLRSVGQAQLMLEAGMFVPAAELSASISTGVFTHYKREEDAAMERGKLDEELDRMSVIADQIEPGGLLLCNESFASTNEREGSQIAREIIRAMTEAGIRIVYVTHLYDLADSLHASDGNHALFLRAEREPDGGRTYRLPAGPPLPTSYGADLYRQVFGALRLGGECGRGEGARGVHGAAHRVRPAQVAQVGEREQRVGADHHGQVAPELREAGRIEPARRGRERGVDQAEPVPGPPRGTRGPGDRAGDHRADRALVGKHAVEQQPRRVADPLDRIRAVRDRRERLTRVRPGALVGLEQERDQIGKVPVGGRLGDERRLRHRRHRDLRAGSGQLMDRLHDGGTGTCLLVHPGSHRPIVLARSRSRQVHSRYERRLA
jgi:MutS domain V